jgi:hypothetical protein
MYTTYYILQEIYRVTVLCAYWRDAFFVMNPSTVVQLYTVLLLQYIEYSKYYTLRLPVDVCFARQSK